MDKGSRPRIGIIFNFRKGWMGGLIYIVNLVNALNFLEDEEKPEIVVFHTAELEELTKEMKYPYLKIVPWTFPDIYKGYFLTYLTRRNAFYQDLIDQYQLDGIYPANDQPLAQSKKQYKKTKMVAWIPDLQHKFYPQFLDKKRIFLRELRIKIILRNVKHLVVSSHDVESHFRKFYHIRKDLKIHVLQFVSIINNFSFEGIEDLYTKYSIPKEYFMVSNQFINHKNHFVILEALVLLKAKGIKVHFVFTGKMEFKQNQEYIKKIRTFIADNGIQDAISFLDVIPRQDQLCLMKHSKAVVQPSLFEGWSTVIEDAISLQVPVIASDLDVNIEQLGDAGTFFKAQDAEQLANLLSTYPTHDGSDIYEKYDDRIAKYGKKFLQIFCA